MQTEAAQETRDAEFSTFYLAAAVVAVVHSCTRIYGS